MSLWALVDVGLLGVVRADRPAHPLLVPPDLVHAVVVAAAVGDADLVEVAVEEQAPQGVLAAGRAAVDADAGQVHVRILRGGGFDPEDAVGKAGVAQILPADVMERLGAVGGAHAVDLHDDESQIRHALLSRVEGESLGDERVVRACIDVLDDRILLAPGRNCRGGR